MIHQKVMESIKEQYLALPKEPIFIAHYGSYNYGMETENSDVDTKAMIAPSMRDVILGKKMVSKVYQMNEIDQCDVKDLRLMIQNFQKQNINFLEILFTPYHYINPKYEKELQVLIENRERIANVDNHLIMKTMSGMARQKFIALEHPYPSIKDKIDKYGYCGKQLHHIARLDQFITRWVMSEESFESRLRPYPETVSTLIAYKNNEPSLEEARRIANESMIHIDKMRETYLSEVPQVVDEDIEEFFEEIIFSMIRKGW